MLVTARTLLIFGTLVCLVATSSEAARLHPGDLVVIDSGGKQLVRIDPNTGSRERITSWKDDTGLRLHFPWGIAIDAEHGILVCDMNARAVFAIDPATGSKKLLSGHSKGSGPSFDSPRGITADGRGGAYVSNTRRRGRNTSHFVFHVDLATGDRRIISAEDIGDGPKLEFLTDLVFEPEGTLLINLRLLGAVYRIDPSNGERRVISSTDVGSGPRMGAPFGIARLAGGDVVITDRKQAHVVRIDTTTGNRAIVSSAEVGRGPPLKGPFGVAEAANGDLFVSDIGSASVFRIDKDTGERRVIASQEVGSGPILTIPRNLAIVPGAVNPAGSRFLFTATGLATLGAVAIAILIIRRKGSTATPSSVGDSTR